MDSRSTVLPHVLICTIDSSTNPSYTVSLNVPFPASCSMQTSSLLLRLEALVAARLLTPEQGSVLRVLAWQHDMGLIKAYQEIRNNKDERQVAGVLAGRCSWLRPPGLNVVHIASEMAPVAKVRRGIKRWVEGTGGTGSGGIACAVCQVGCVRGLAIHSSSGTWQPWLRSYGAPLAVRFACSCCTGGRPGGRDCVAGQGAPGLGAADGNHPAEVRLHQVR